MFIPKGKIIKGSAIGILTLKVRSAVGVLTLTIFLFQAQLVHAVVFYVHCLKF